MNWNQLGTTPQEEQAPLNLTSTEFDLGMVDDSSSLFSGLTSSSNNFSLGNNIYSFNLTNSGNNFVGFNNTIDFSLPALTSSMTSNVLSTTNNTDQQQQQQQFNYDTNNNNNSYFYQSIVPQGQPLQQPQVQQQPIYEQPQHQQQQDYSIDYSLPNDIISGSVYSIDGQLHSLQSTSDYSSPMDNSATIMSSPSVHVPSSPSTSISALSSASSMRTTTTTTSVSSPPAPSPSSSNDEDEDVDSSADESDDSESDSHRSNRPTKKRKNSFDPNHNYGPILPKNIQLEISSKEFEAYRQKFYSGKVSKEVASSLKSQERKIKNRESAQKSRERKSRNLQELEDKLREENVKTSSLEAKLKEASMKNSYLEEEVRRLKAELTNRNSVVPAPYFSNNDSCSSSSSSSFSNFLSIGNGIPAVAGGQRLACFFLLFLVILFSNSPYVYNGYYGNGASATANGGGRHAPSTFQTASNLRSIYSIPNNKHLQMVQPFEIVRDSRYIYGWKGHSNGEITITYNPETGKDILRNVLDKHDRLSSPEQQLPLPKKSTTTTTTTTTTTSSASSSKPSKLTSSELSSSSVSSSDSAVAPMVPASQHDHFHSTIPDADDEICDIPQLPNNSSVKISIRSNYKITSPDGNSNHSAIPQIDDDMVGQHNSDQQQFNYKELNVDVELLFPSKIFENGSNEISKLLMSANNGQPLKIVASVLDLESAGSSTQNNHSQHQEPTFTHKQIDNLD